MQTLMSNPANIAESVKDSDLVVGAVLIPGAKAPKLVSEDMVKSMQPGSVIVDVAIDQGGNFETVDHITTHDDPIYENMVCCIMLWRTFLAPFRVLQPLH